jgi:hypothetical protein
LGGLHQAVVESFQVAAWDAHPPLLRYPDEEEPLFLAVLFVL